MSTEEVKTEVVEQATTKKKAAKKKIAKSSDPNLPPKITRSLKKKIDAANLNVEAIVRHIQNVQDNCLILGKKLIDRGEIELGVGLIRNGFMHDLSKFSGVEWDNMTPLTTIEERNEKVKLKIAIQHHSKTNSHHPEYWNGIKNMPDIAILEMVCDWKARSEEFGTSLRDWIEESALKRWEFTKEDFIYKKIIQYVDMLCEKPFSAIKN